jgi:hypothetical protein
VRSAELQREVSPCDRSTLTNSFRCMVRACRNGTGGWICWQVPYAAIRQSHLAAMMVLFVLKSDTLSE